MSLPHSIQTISKVHPASDSENTSDASSGLKREEREADQSLPSAADVAISLTAVRLNGLAFNPYPTAFPYGNGMVLHFYRQQESSTTKTVHKVINKRLKTYV